ncbi:MAG: hypothetical protein P8M03_06950 [Flavobacteriaceae bacterium]|nr:hypothetical protein [Flavobacteriaceae bacterium]
MNYYSIFILLIILNQSMINGQNNEQEYNYNDEEYNYDEYEFLEPINDNSHEGQITFISELLDSSGYIINSIITYQTLPNNARVFRVDLENGENGFIFIRWDKKKKENYVANKLIDSEIYYNLKATQEIKRKQTDKESFGIEDIAIQASDQEKISEGDIIELREQYRKEQEERELAKQEKLKKTK